MAEAKVNQQGQITLPDEVRLALGLEPGDEIIFAKSRGGFVIFKKGSPSPLDKWVGYLEHMKGVDVDEYIRELRGA